MALLLLACTLQTSTAATSAEIRQRGKLIVGVSDVVPEYKAGAKYRTPESFASTVATDALRATTRLLPTAH